MSRRLWPLKEKLLLDNFHREYDSSIIAMIVLPSLHSFIKPSAGRTFEPSWRARERQGSNALSGMTDEKWQCVRVVWHYLRAILEVAWTTSRLLCARGYLHSTFEFRSVPKQVREQVRWPERKLYISEQFSRLTTSFHSRSASKIDTDYRHLSHIFLNSSLAVAWLLRQF